MIFTKSNVLSPITVSHRTMRQVVDHLFSMIDARQGCKYVVTPNLDHLRLLSSDTALRDAYAGATLATADGFPVRSFYGAPERVSGVDLALEMFRKANPARKLKVFLLGAKPGVAHQAAVRMVDAYPGYDSAGHHAPPHGFENDKRQTEVCIHLINATKPDLLILGLGCPKQEIWIHKNHHRLNVPVALCGGGTIDFLAGVQKRAPRWVSGLRAEWFWRWCHDPKRLTGRYARDIGYYAQVRWAMWSNDVRFGVARKEIG